MRSRLAAAVIALGAVVLPGCTSDPKPSAAASLSFSAEQDLHAEITTWHAGKRAALTIEFDDNRKTHYTVAAPALEQRGLRATFAINSGLIRDGDWKFWIGLTWAGHELANHTRSHPHLSLLTIDAAREEIERGRAELLSHVPGLDDVVSFVYPYGDQSAAVREIVMEAHLSARGAAGTCNAPVPDDYGLLHGGNGSDPAKLRAQIEECLAAGAWRIQFFHSISAQEIDENDFLTYLDYVASLTDSLWVAPQGEVTRYAMERDACHALVHGENPAVLKITRPPRGERLSLPLTVRLTVSAQDVGSLLVGSVEYPLDSQGCALIDLAPGDSVEVEGLPR